MQQNRSKLTTHQRSGGISCLKTRLKEIYMDMHLEAPHGFSKHRLHIDLIQNMFYTLPHTITRYRSKNPEETISDEV